MSAIWTCVICGVALYHYDMPPCVQPEFGQLVKIKSRIWMTIKSPSQRRSSYSDSRWSRTDKQLENGELAIAIMTTNFANWSQDAWFETLIISCYGIGWVASEELVIIA